MYITLETDYAIRMVRQLFVNSWRMDARRISEETGVTLRFALKILGKLASAGIIRSFAGAQGGYEVVRKASEITLYDMIEAIEGPYMISRCLDEGYCCPKNLEEDGCRVHQVFEEVNAEIAGLLKSITFERFM